MKKILLSVLLLVGFVCTSKSANAGIPVFYGTGPEFVTLQQLPDSMQIDGNHVNFGVAFKQFSIFWIPLWNYGEVSYAAIEDNGQSAYSLDGDDLAFLHETYGIDIDKAPTIPFWHRIGGKLILALAIALLIWGSYSRKKNTDEKDNREGNKEEISAEPQPAEEKENHN